jgi:hypothetical protein
MSTPTWTNLIVGHEQANPLTLKPHPLNFYTHPMQQRKVVSAAIEDIGYIDEVVVNRRTGHTLNGHLRVELASGTARRRSRSPSSTVTRRLRTRSCCSSTASASRPRPRATG